MTDAVRTPVAVGENVTIILHVPFTPIPVPQVLVWLKSLGSVPATVMLKIERGAPPGFVSVMVFSTLVVPVSCPANVTLVGDNFTAGPVTDKLKLKAVPQPLAPPPFVVP